MVGKDLQNIIKDASEETWKSGGSSASFSRKAAGPFLQDPFSAARSVEEAFAWLASTLASASKIPLLLGNTTVQDIQLLKDWAGKLQRIQTAQLYSFSCRQFGPECMLALRKLLRPRVAEGKILVEGKMLRLWLCPLATASPKALDASGADSALKAVSYLAGVESSRQGSFRL